MTDSPQTMNSLDCWDYTIELECLEGTQDLQLAAELGKTLLERNKELENSLKQQQNVIEDQTQEIEYLTKQTAALREVNDSRLRIYEQLEVNIQDLERANHRLAVENASDKKHIKSLTASIETLEQKCEHLQSNIDELTLQLEVERRKSQRAAASQRQTVTYTRYSINHNRNNDVDDDCHTNPIQTYAHTKTERCVNATRSERCQQTQTTPKRDEPDSNEVESKEIEQISHLMQQLRERDTQCARDQRKVTELEEQLEIMHEQNKILEKQLSQYHMKDEEIKSVQDELSSLEEVRLGQLCSKCLGNMNGDDISLSACDDDDSSMFEALNERSQFRTSYSMDVQEYNNTPSPIRQNNSLYKDLVQKYQALLEVHRIPNNKSSKQPNSLSLQEELQMSGDFNNLTKDTDEESGHGDSLKTEKQNQKARKAFSRTPTDFSEAETSSSGFCDETCSKTTQTDEMRLIPGSFLCTIGDGNDCIRIYDDTTSPIESRFRNRPEYRELFKEIFEVLNKASKTKNEDETLPILDDENKIPDVPPVTPCVEQLPDFPDDTQSIITDDTQSVMSSTMSQSSSQQEVTITEGPKEEETNVEETSQERVLTPLIRQPLEFISVKVNVRKRSSSRKKKPYAERSDSPVTHIVGSPKVTYSNRHSSGRRRKDGKIINDIWKGNTAIFYNRNIGSPTPSQDKGYKYEHAFEFKPSPASQELHRLKTLDRTYADVLRKSDKTVNWRRQN